jgi:hypothetical protein
MSPNKDFHDLSCIHAAVPADRSDYVNCTPGMGRRRRTCNRSARKNGPHLGSFLKKTPTRAESTVPSKEKTPAQLGLGGIKPRRGSDPDHPVRLRTRPVKHRSRDDVPDERSAGRPTVEYCASLSRTERRLSRRPVPVVEENLVVEKRLVLKEELHIRRSITRRAFEVPVQLRKQRAVIQRLGPEPAEEN